MQQQAHSQSIECSEPDALPACQHDRKKNIVFVKHASRQRQILDAAIVC
jgi:hypothetical protein